jgi:hypothetical protein
LLATAPGTSFPGLGNLVGVPLGKYDFGSGLVGVGDTDTIIQRTADATVTAVGQTAMNVPFNLVALQMETATPVNFNGNGLDNYFITLQSTHGGPVSTGTANITFLSTGGGYFTTSFDVNFDIHEGSLTGQIVDSETLPLTNTDGVYWEHSPPLPGGVLIPRVNYSLFTQGLPPFDPSQDFWPVMPVPPGVVPTQPPGGPGGFGDFTVWTDDELQRHVVGNASIPEPSTWIMLVTAALIVPAYARWGRRRA